MKKLIKYFTFILCITIISGVNAKEIRIDPHVNYFTTVKLNATLTYEVTGENENFTKQSEEMTGNYTDDNVNAKITEFRGDLATFANSHGINTPNVVSGLVNEYYYDAHEEFTTVTSANQASICLGIDDCEIDDTIIQTILDKHQTYLISSALTSKEIKTINVNLTAPTVGNVVALDGQIPNIVPTATTSDKITIDDTMWIKGTYTSFGDGYDDNFTGSFEKDTEYYAMISVSAKEGYLLVNDLTIKVNGEAPAEVFAVQSNNNVHFIAKIKAKSSPKEYTLTTSGITLSFIEEAGKTFTLQAFDVLTFTDEQLETLGVSRSEYNNILKTITNNTSKLGSLISVYGLEVNGEGGQDYTGETKIKIKLTDKLKKYKSLKLVYIDDTNGYAAKDVVELTVEGDYLVGTLPHLSVYALVGEESLSTSNPKTGDHIILYILVLSISVLGLIGIKVLNKKNQ